MYDNIIFTDNEYNKHLGCYIKWLHGSSEAQIEKLYSVSAFHLFTRTFIKNEYNKYAEYLDQMCINIIENFTDWTVRVYIDLSIFSKDNPDRNLWIEKIDILKKYEQIQIICIKMPRYYNKEYNIHNGLLPVMFRYLPLFEKNTGVCLFRDIDNIWTHQHHYFVNKWLNEGDEELCLFLNKDYKRQQIVDLTENDIVLENKYYNTILSGLWGIRKKVGYSFSSEIWCRMFGYLESFTDFVNDIKYKDFTYYKIRFTYGFDELCLTRIMIPIFLNTGMRAYAIPLKIFDINYINNFFDNAIVRKLLRSLMNTDDMIIIKKIIIDNYWHMDTPNAGLSQFMLCVLTNIYFEIINKKSNIFKNDILINGIREKIYPVPVLMSMGVFTFKNYKKYDWFKKGAPLVDRFILNGQKITLDEITVYSDLSNNGDGVELQPSYGI